LFEPILQNPEISELDVKMKNESESGNVSDCEDKTYGEYLNLMSLEPCAVLQILTERWQKSIWKKAKIATNIKILAFTNSVL
jgi:hypothetical protein